MTQPIPAAWVKTLIRGDDRRWTETFEESDDGGVTKAPKDLTGFTFICQIRDDPNSSDVMATVDVTLADDPTTGVVNCSLTHTEAANLVPGKVYIDLQGTNADGFVQTYLSGKWTVKPDVSR